MMLGILYVFLLLIAGEAWPVNQGLELRCMISCSRSGCASDDPHKFLWCMAKCGHTLSYIDLRACVAAFFAHNEMHSTTCEKRLATVGCSTLKSRSIFCSVLKEVFIKKRSDPPVVRKGLYIRALQEVVDIRDLMKHFITLSES